MKAYKNILLCALTIAAVGCAGKLPTKSGNPEVSIPHSTINTVSGALAERLATAGFIITMQTDNIISAWKMGTAFMDTGNKYTRQYSMTQKGQDVYIVLTPAINDNPKLYQKALDGLQDELNLFRDHVISVK